MTQQEVTKSRLEYLTIKQFIERYDLKLTPEAIGYHMRTDKVDWMQPVRDRFVVLSKKTLKHYNLC